jgi:hypothetical protein
MLKRTCIFVAALSFLVVLGLPLAQAQSNNLMIVHVPFDFYVRDQMMPAGAYRITALTDDGATLLIRSEDGRAAVAVLTNGADAKGRQPYAPHLVFNRYGEQSFLISAWRDAKNGRELSQSQRERSLRRELAQAGRAVAPEVVTIAADTNGN